jgi:hypothetical protein
MSIGRDSIFQLLPPHSRLKYVPAQPWRVLLIQHLPLFNERTRAIILGPTGALACRYQLNPSEASRVLLDC